MNKKYNNAKSFAISCQKYSPVNINKFSILLFRTLFAQRSWMSECVTNVFLFVLVTKFLHGLFLLIQRMMRDAIKWCGISRIEFYIISYVSINQLRKHCWNDIVIIAVGGDRGTSTRSIIKIIISATLFCITCILCYKIDAMKVIIDTNTGIAFRNWIYFSFICSFPLVMISNIVVSFNCFYANILMQLQ